MKEPHKEKKNELSVESPFSLIVDTVAVDWQKTLFRVRIRQIIFYIIGGK